MLGVVVGTEEVSGNVGDIDGVFDGDFVGDDVGAKVQAKSKQQL